MTKFVSQLLANEVIIFQTKKHPIIFLYPLCISLVILTSIPYILHNTILVHLIWVPCLVLAIIWLQSGLEYYFSGYYVTNQRVILQEGFFFRHISETLLNAVAQLRIEQSIVGQWLNYGSVEIYAMGATDLFNWVARPTLLQAAINKAKINY